VTAGGIRAILFDFDGVLVDSEPTRFRAGRAALADGGLSLSWELFARHWLGRPDEAALRDILGHRFDAEGPAVLARRHAAYAELLAEVPLFPDAARLLRRLPAALRLAVASGSRRPEVTGVLAREGLAFRFHTLVTAEDYARAKPAPDPFLAAARAVAESPAACLVVEDSPAGVAAAQAAGMRVVAVDRSGAGAVLGGPTWRIDSLDRLQVDAGGRMTIACEAPPGAPRD
jgi:beta-phosphoglucomutase